MESIYNAIATKYADAQQINVPWVDGQWITEQVWPIEVVGYVDPGWDGNFLEDVIECLDPNIYWTVHNEGDWSSVDRKDALLFGWDDFKNQVLTKTRYFFQNHVEDEYEAMRGDSVPINKVMEVLGEICSKSGMLKLVEPGTEFYRVRVSKNKQNYETFDELGVPPHEITNAGRMNPAGIPYFYVAFDKETACAEVLSESVDFCLAKFVNTVPIPVIDFTKQLEIPSIFDLGKTKERQNQLFLRDFINDLIKPVEKNNREHVEYVPTQVVSEFFRYVFIDENGDSIKGLVYPSVKNLEGVNLAVFESDNDFLQKSFELVDVEYHTSETEYACS